MTVVRQLQQEKEQEWKTKAQQQEKKRALEEMVRVLEEKGLAAAKAHKRAGCGAWAVGVGGAYLLRSSRPPCRVHNKLTWIVVALIRALHFIFKAGDRSKTATFNRDVLGMTNLRYKEFEEGCKATCKGPYDGKWSKTTVGFGPEVDDFVAELFYGYGVGEFRLGNDFLGLTLQSSQAVNNANWLGWPLTEVGKGLYLVEASGGYHFYLVDKDQPPNDPVQNVSLAWSDLQESIHCCSSLLGMKVKENNEEKKTVLMGFTDTHCKLELHNIVGTVDHGTAFGRIAFSCPREQFSDLEALMTKGKHQIFTILVSLDTSGKATVEVVIRADSDAHEICFVF
ncbi:glyoxalase domain-containing protein 4-like [Salmo trutta]|uniref:glyoxalase domain-containing protein 4-like n=1 Tax=Salmo trutta TaxID=8032 RepID=UPI001130DEC3|nr:glyoxalase domain-containing protein 4-like [Salmo trutta]